MVNTATQAPNTRPFRTMSVPATNSVPDVNGSTFEIQGQKPLRRCRAKAASPPLLRNQRDDHSERQDSGNHRNRKTIKQKPIR